MQSALEHALSRAVLRSATTLSPDRAILIECAWESAPNPVTAQALEVRMKRFAECAETLTPLLPSYAELAVFAKPESAAQLRSSCENALRGLGIDAEISVYGDDDSGDTTNNGGRLALLDVGSLSREILLRSDLPSDSAEFDALVADAVQNFGTDAIPYVLGVGAADDAESAKTLARSAITRSAVRESNTSLLAAHTRRIGGRLNRFGSDRVALSVVVEARGTGYVCIIAADSFVNPVRFTV
ncbi:MAG: hypothetical protein LBN02_00060 [Oscillospiraceae bacterium]|jgi:hypothetical protein|nr:hypothetical protein [Oscillospiraceae bacterium]